MTFYLFGIIMFIAGILALVFVKEEFTPHEVAKNASRKEKSALAQVNSLPIVIAMFITAMLVMPLLSQLTQSLVCLSGSYYTAMAVYRLSAELSLPFLGLQPLWLLIG